MKIIEKWLRKIKRKDVTYFVSYSGEYEETRAVFFSQSMNEVNVNRKMSFEDFETLKRKLEILMKNHIEETHQMKVKNIIITNIMDITKL
jgi:hypothetical protein